MAGSSEYDLSFILSYIEHYWPDFPVTQHQLEHPTSELAIQFYEQFRTSMKYLLNQMVENRITETSLCVKTDNDSIFPLVRFVNKYFKKLSTGQADCTLTLTDLYVPTAKRTKLRFKILINVLVFAESQLENIKGPVVKCLQQAEEFKTKTDGKEQLKVELAKEAENIAHNDDDYLKLQKQLLKAEALYAQLQEKKEDTGRHCKKLQHELTMLVSTYENKQALLTNVKANIQHLSEGVVTEDSYKSLQDLKENLTIKCEVLENDISCMSTNLENKKPTVEHFFNVIKRIEVASCEEAKELENIIVNYRLQLESYEFKYKEKLKEIQKMQENKLGHKENIKVKIEKLQSQAFKDATLLEQIKRQIKQIKLEQAEEESTQNDINNKKYILQRQISDLEGKCEELLKRIEKLNVECGNAYTEMLNKENVITNDFNKMLEDVAKPLANK